MRTAAELQDLAQARAQKHSVVVHGVATDYWVYPAQKNPEASETIVLVHGYRGDHHGLESFAGALDEFNVVAPDLPGFGSSAPLKVEHTLDNYIAWMIDFVGELKLDKPIAIGHSFGTLIITGAQDQKEIFKAMICINPVAGGITKGLSRILLNFVKFYYFIAHKLPERAGMKMVTTFLLVDSMSAYTTKSKDKKLRRWVKYQHRKHFNSFANSQVVWESYIASISHRIQPYMKNVSVPVLFVAAELDEVTPVSEVVKLKEEMSQSSNSKIEPELHVVKNCGHLVHYEAAEQTAKQIKNFIAKEVS